MAQVWGAPTAVAIASGVTLVLSLILIMVSRALRNIDAAVAEARLTQPSFRAFSASRSPTPPAAPAPTSAAQ
jgi:hypothetical protein